MGWALSTCFCDDVALFIVLSSGGQHTFVFKKSLVSQGERISALDMCLCLRGWVSRLVPFFAWVKTARFRI